MKIEWAITCQDARRGPDGLLTLVGVEGALHADRFPVKLTLCVAICISIEEAINAPEPYDFDLTVLGPDKKPVLEEQTFEVTVSPARHGRPPGSGGRCQVPLKVEFVAFQPGIHSIEISWRSDSVSVPLIIAAPGRN